MTNIPRLYIDAQLQAGGEAIDLPDAQAKYLTRVMRLPDGARVRAFNGADGEWACRLAVAGRQVQLHPEMQLRPPEAGPDLTLFFAPVKKTRTDFIVEKACELGVRAIVPVMTAYTQSARVRTDRLQALVTEAAEQTERLDLPHVSEAMTLAAALAKWPDAAPLYYCDEAANAAPMRAAVTPAAQAGILIGPEGGFSAQERAMLRQRPGIVPVTLGPRILRAETAAVAALTIWQSQVGDWTQAPYLPKT